VAGAKGLSARPLRLAGFQPQVGAVPDVRHPSVRGPYPANSAQLRIGEVEP